MNVHRKGAYRADWLKCRAAEWKNDANISTRLSAKLRAKIAEDLVKLELLVLDIYTSMGGW
jgi:hypothetical protein